MYTTRDRSGHATGHGLGYGLGYSPGLGFQQHTNAGLGFQQQQTPFGLGFQSSQPAPQHQQHIRYSSPTSRCFSIDYNRRTPSPPPSTRPASSNHGFSRKTVRFGQTNPALRRSQSVSRSASVLPPNSFQPPSYQAPCPETQNTGAFTATARQESPNTYNPMYRACSPTKDARAIAAEACMLKQADHLNLNVLLRRLSVLQLEMKGLLHGKSLREKANIIGQKVDDDYHMMSNHLQAKTNARRDVWLLEENNGSGHGSFHNKQLPSPQALEAFRARAAIEQQHRLGRDMNVNVVNVPIEMTTDTVMKPKKLGVGFELESMEPESLRVESIDPEKRDNQQIVHIWNEYNCDLHLKRIIDGSRKDAAVRLVEKVVHSRLTYYMLQYITSVAKGLIGDEKTHYLGFFKKEGPFKCKPLNEGTYCELLMFVAKQINPAKDIVKALQVSEDGWEEEACSAGYDPTGVGDIRAQMKIFAAIAASSGSPPTPLALSQQDLEDADIFQAEYLRDLMNAADHGRLGPLQKASNIVKMACFMALKRLELFSL